MKKQKRQDVPYQKLPIDDCIPNDWNPNKVDPGKMSKLRTGVAKLLELGGNIPPIVVRPHPSNKDKFQIIDGFHRLVVCQELEQEAIDAFVLDVDDAMARILTSTLNYLRGEPVEDKYGDLIAQLVKGGMSVEQVAEFMPESSEELLDFVDRSSAAMDVYNILSEQERKAEEEAKERGDEEDEKDATDKEEENTFVEVKFLVSGAQARVIESEIDRIEGLLTGRNRRGRALEFMAVNSAQTPIESLSDLMGEDDKKRVKRKAKMVDREEPKAKSRAKAKLEELEADDGD